MNCSKVALQVKTNFLLGKQATQAQSTLKAEEETLEMIDKSGKEGEGEWEGEESAGAEGEGRMVNLMKGQDLFQTRLYSCFVYLHIHRTL